MKKNIIILLAVAFGLFGCDGLLSKNPDNRTDLNSKEALNAMLVSVYPDWSYVWLSELMSDNLTDVGPIAPYNDVTIGQMYNWDKVDAEYQDTPAGYWNMSYVAIATANTVLEAIDRMVEEGTYTESELSAQRGEALMARAYAHFMLVNLFGEHYDPATAGNNLSIPYVTEVEKVPNVTYVRKTVKEVYELIDKDIQAAMPYKGTSLINDSEMGKKSWHMNTKAAATFASRYYLWRGENGDWDKVVYYADMVLGSEPAAALRDWAVTDNDMSGDEAMSWDEFSQEYSRSRVSANLQLKECISSGANDRAALYRYTMSDNLQTEIIGFGSSYDIFPTKKKMTHLFINMALGYTTYDCYFIYKLKEEFQRNGVNANYGTPYVMYPLFVAEEALFNKAEAEVMRGNFDVARDLMDAYLSRRIKLAKNETYSTEVYGVSDERVKAIYTDDKQHGDINPHYALTAEQKVYVKCLLRLRRTEFVHEGMRWFDIKRMHIEVKHNNVGGTLNVLTPDDPRRVLALPESALSSGMLVDPGVSEVKPVEKVNINEKPQNVIKNGTDNIYVKQDGHDE